MKMKKLLSLLTTLSTTFAKSSICTMKKQRNLIFHFTLLTNCLYDYPLVCGSPSGHTAIRSPGSALLQPRVGLQHVLGKTDC